MDKKDLGRLEDIIGALEDLHVELSQLGLTGPAYDLYHASNKLTEIYDEENEEV